MEVVVALLRGVNVGGSGRLAMKTLRCVAVDAGFHDVATYVQSGNLVLRTAHDPASAGDVLHDALLAASGLDLAVVTRTASEWAGVIESNPFPDAASDGTRLHVTFLREPPGPELATVDADPFAPERYAVVGREVYMSLPDGLGRSKLAVALDRAAAKGAQIGTTRNWNTILKIAELAAA
jgi:uncharacterized protein (DUF1697 family)